MIMKAVYLMLIFVLCSYNVFSQKKSEHKISIYASVEDKVTRVSLKNIKVTLMLPDSIVIDSCINNFGYNNAKDLFCFRVGVGDYIVKTEPDAYD